MPTTGQAIRASFADSLLRNILAPHYFFHVPVGEAHCAYPLFARELEMSGGSLPAAWVEQAMCLLEVFGLPLTAHYLAAVLGIPVRAPAGSHEHVQAYVDQEAFDLLDGADCRRFAALGRVPLQGSFGVRAARRPVTLVLGAFFPESYADLLFDHPLTPAQKLAGGENLLAFERTLAICQHLREWGYESAVSKTHSRHILNVYLRVRALMQSAQRIVILLTPGSASLAIEYGVVCGTYELARKAIVLVPRDTQFTTVGRDGTFLLEYPRHCFYDNDADILVKLDQALQDAHADALAVG